MCQRTLAFSIIASLLNAIITGTAKEISSVEYPLAGQAGFSTVFENQPADIQNKGWEFTLTSTNIKKARI